MPVLIGPGTINASVVIEKKTRYIEIAGRVTALFVGSVAVQVIMLWLVKWSEKF